MRRSKFIKAVVAAGVAAVITGCSSVSTPQNLTGSIPLTFAFPTQSIQGTNSENQVHITLTHAEMVKSEEGAEFPVELQILGRFAHLNPRVKTDSPFELRAGFFLKHHGDGIVSIESPEMIDMELLSVHTPVRGIVHRDAKHGFAKMLQKIDGRYLPEQKILKFSSQIISLFEGSNQ